MPPETLLLRNSAGPWPNPAAHRVSFSKFATPYSLLLQGHGWSRLFSKIPTLSSGKITRADVISCFTPSNDQAPDYEVAFIACMLWGFGVRNKSGPVKTWIGLQGKSFNSIMQNTETYLRTGHLGKAMVEIIKIDEIGTAFGSKILYFMGQALRAAPMPLVFDSIVCASLVAIFGSQKAKSLFGIQKGLPPSVSDVRGYVAYCEALNTWAKQLAPSCTADQLELYLFDDKKNLVRAYKAKGSPLG
jgi:hypothetical protein